MNAMTIGTIVVLIIVIAICIPAGRHMVKTWRGDGSCCGGGSGSKKTKKVSVADTDESHYPYSQDVKVSGMTCLNCKNNVENAINALGDTLTKVDLDAGVAHVLSKNPIDMMRVEQAVVDAGYYVVRTR